ncbi:hypothetical protein GXW82_08045 [Streptacidiphilus sp. 4-A2]|nr:hypothetical protein [Streptacidiphilus sp. 4-A2]
MSTAVYTAGAAFMLSPSTTQAGLDLGFTSMPEFYVAGRGGVLGDVDASVVTAAFGFFADDWVRPRWESATAHLPAREAGRNYGARCAAWGRAHLDESPELTRLVGYTTRITTAVDSSGLALFAGWRAEPAATDTPGRAMQLVHLLREWRGGLLLAAVLSAGLSTRDAVLADGGPEHAGNHGWPGLAPADAALSERLAQCLASTDRLCGSLYESVLAPAERSDFAEIVHALLAPLAPHS